MPHWVDEYVGKRVRALRKERRLSQGALGERIGVTFQQVQKYEKGTNRVSASTLYDIARALQVPYEDLLPRQEDDPEVSIARENSITCARTLSVRIAELARDVNRHLNEL
jgi:transcriptional regulator with XRE-family HTH domain